MKSSFYREKWSAIKATPVTREEISRLSRQIAHSFMDSYLKDCHYEEDYIDLLCEMTTFSEDNDLTGMAARALFRIIIESLCDDFEDLQTETYNRVMAQLISFCRKLPSGQDLDGCLNDFEIFDRNDLLNRIKTIRGNGKHLGRQKDVKKILLLSRVTIAVRPRFFPRVLMNTLPQTVRFGLSMCLSMIWTSQDWGLGPSQRRWAGRPITPARCSSCISTGT